MRSILSILLGVILGVTYSLNAQEVENPPEALTDQTWYLTKMIIDEEEILFIPNEEVDQSLLIIEDFWSSGDDEVLAHIVYCDYQSVDIYFKDTDYNEFYLPAFTIWSKLFNTGCANDSNSYFQSTLLYEFWNNPDLFLENDTNYSFHFTYSIFQHDNHQSLIVINDNGDQTHYQSIPYLSVKNQHKSNLTLYPNPADDFLHIENLTEPVQIEIYDLSGKILLSQEINEAEKRVNLSRLGEGIYLYQLRQQGQKVKTGKLVKN